MRTAHQLRRILSFSFNDLNDVIKILAEKELCDLLNMEVDALARPYMIERIYGRYNKLRSARELKDLLHGKKITGNS